MSLHSLPSELIHRICAWCDLMQIRALRLTSRNISAIADEYLLDELYTFFETTSLRKLDDIARSAITIRRGIESFCFQADGLEHETFAQWDAQRENRATANCLRIQLILNATTGYESLPSVEEKSDRLRPLHSAILSLPRQPPYSPEQLERLMVHYEAYEHAVNRQHILQEPGTIRSTLITLFEALPNLSTIQVNSGSILRSNKAILHRPFQDTLVIPHETRKIAEHVLIETLLAAIDASTTIRRLDVGAVEHTFLNEVLTRPGEIQKCFNLFRGVEVLNWIFPPSRTQEPLDLEFNRTLWSVEEDFAKWLQMFESVEKLNLLFPDSAAPHWTADLTTTMQNCHWRNLTSFSMGNFQTSGDDLTAMLLRHASTLRSFKLSAVHLNKGSNWPHCFRSIAGKLPHLLGVTLLGSFTSEDDETDGTYKYDFDSCRGPDIPGDVMEQYILEGGAGDVPIQPRLIPLGGVINEPWDHWLYEGDSEDDDENEADIVDREDSDIDWDDEERFVAGLIGA